MNKKILATVFIALVLMGSVVLAAVTPPKPGQGQKSNIVSDQKQEVNTSLQVRIQGTNISRVRNAHELRDFVRQSRENMKNSTKEIKSQFKEIHQNQNRVRIAVHAMLAAENLTDGIGKNISQIAREFNNSVQKTTVAEEKIKSRGRIVRFFFGGDKKIANEINEEVNQNENRIQKLNQFMESCDCDPEVKTILQEQIQSIQQEQERLRQVAQEEKSKKGIFGWLFK